jgi:hypothetical protein
MRRKDVTRLVQEDIIAVVEDPFEISPRMEHQPHFLQNQLTLEIANKVLNFSCFLNSFSFI